MGVKKGNKYVTVTLPESLIYQMDLYCVNTGLKRSDFVKYAIMKALEPVSDTICPWDFSKKIE